MSLKSELINHSCDIRSIVLKMAHDSASPHIACAFSCVDIIATLFFHTMKPEDRFILSKGHGCMSYYAALYKKGKIGELALYSYAKNGSRLPEHPSPDLGLGIEVGTGSLGHGLSIALGAALARKIKGNQGREFVLLGDGECNEGSVWEAAMLGSNLNLGNLVAIIDNNSMQATGFHDKCSLKAKFNAFGWNVYSVDGNDVDFLVDVFNSINYKNGKPNVIIANTIKGKGVSFMENVLEWHYRIPNEEEYSNALQEIEYQRA